MSDLHDVLTAPGGARVTSTFIVVAVLVALAAPAFAAAPPGGEGKVETLIIKKNPVRCRILRWDARHIWLVPIFGDLELDPMRFSWNDIPATERDRITGADKPHSAVKELLESGGGGLVKALRIRLPNNAVFTGVEVEGRSTDEELVIRTRSIPEARFRREDILSIETVMLPRTVFYTVEEIYQEWREESDPDTAREHVALADRLMELKHWVRAVEHYQSAAVLDPGYADSVAGRIATARAAMLSDRVKEMDRKIRADVRAWRWWSALRRIDLLAAFAPEHPTRTGWDAKRAGLVAKLRKDLRRMIVLSYYRKMTEFVRKRAWGFVADGGTPGVVVTTTSRGAFTGALVSDDGEYVVIKSDDGTINIARDMVTSIKPLLIGARRRRTTFQESKDYVADATGGIGADILKGLETEFAKYSTPDVPLTQESIKETWDGRLASVRTVHSGGSDRVDAVYAIHVADYGIGTWLRDGEGSDATHAAAAGMEVDPEKWWRGQPYEVRARILQAFAAEALCDVMGISKRDCGGCGGKGRVKLIGGYSSRGGSARICTVCRGRGHSLKVRHR